MLDRSSAVRSLDGRNGNPAIRQGAELGVGRACLGFLSFPIGHRPVELGRRRGRAVAPPLLRAYRLWSITRNVRRAAGWDRGTKRGNDRSTPGGGEQTSRIKTRFLDMSLDHGTGMIAGVVSTGPRAGRKLDDLTLGELLDLHAYYDREDDESRQVFEGYLDQTHPAWRAKTRGKERRSGRETMTRDEALKILGLDERRRCDQKGLSSPDVRRAGSRRVHYLRKLNGGCY